VSKTGLGSVSIGLLALSIFVSVIAIQASAEEEFNLKASLQSPEPDVEAIFGYSISISGDILVISEVRGNVEDKDAGKVYIFDSSGNLLTTMQSPEPRTSFGWAVAISGDTVVVGEYTMDRAHIFDSDGKLQSTLESTGGFLGHSVAVSGDTIVVGEPYTHVEGKLVAGRAHIFDSDGELRSTLQSPTPGHRGYFGCSVATNGDNIVIGEVYVAAMEAPVGPGSVYVFDSEGNLHTTLKSPEQEVSTIFGHSVAISENIIVVGERNADVDGISGAGRVYIFDTDGNLLTTLQAPTPEENAEFGNAVAISGDTVVVGEHRADVEVINEGRAYVFDLDGNLLATLQSPTPGAAASFGWSVAISGDTIVIGEPKAEVEGKLKAGRVHIFGPGPGVEPEAEPEPVSAQEEAKPEAEEKKPGFVIPGFPYASITVGLLIGAFVFWLIQQRR
jgi:hypothetical protein